MCLAEFLCDLFKSKKKVGAVSKVRALECIRCCVLHLTLLFEATKGDDAKWKQADAIDRGILVSSKGNVRRLPVCVKQQIATIMNNTPQMSKRGQVVAGLELAWNRSSKKLKRETELRTESPGEQPLGDDAASSTQIASPSSTVQLARTAERFIKDELWQYHVASVTAATQSRTFGVCIDGVSVVGKEICPTVVWCEQAQVSFFAAPGVPYSILQHSNVCTYPQHRFAEYTSLYVVYVSLMYTHVCGSYSTAHAHAAKLNN